VIAALATIAACSLDRGAIPDASGTDSGTTDSGTTDSGTTDSATACPPGFADLDGTPGCECEIQTETCNGADDDCDRRIDEGITAAEVCDNMVDDDCDMAIDEECECTPVGRMRSCGSATGECMEGMQTCGAGGWSRCTGAVGPGTETCDAARLDEDCNGVPNDGCMCDEGETQTCTSGSCTGTETCDVSGAWGTCSAMSSAETCNGIDDNCDGTTDEGTTCGECTQVNNGTRSYLFCFTIMRDWAGARAYCMMYGYDLATVEDATENVWLNERERALYENNHLWWYGGSDSATEGTWRWVPTMTDVGYMLWDGGEPDNGTSENCLSNENRGTPEWNSDDCTADRIFVCEDQDS